MKICVPPLKPIPMNVNTVLKILSRDCVEFINIQSTDKLCNSFIWFIINK